MIGMHGSKASNMACDGRDLLIAVGCRFSDRVALKPATFARQAKIVQIDIDRAEINKNVETDHHIIGNSQAGAGAAQPERSPSTTTASGTQVRLLLPHGNRL